MFLKTVIRQGEKILKQDKEIKELKEQIKELNSENKAVYEENKQNRFEVADKDFRITKLEKLLENTIKNLYDLQDVSRTGLRVEDKEKRRNIIINKIIKELSDDRKSNK